MIVYFFPNIPNSQYKMAMKKPKFMVSVLLVVPSRSPHLVPVICSKWGLQRNEIGRAHV